MRNGDSQIQIDSISRVDTAGTWPIPTHFVDLIVTSPPYWHHRDNGPHTVTTLGADKQCNHRWKKEGSNQLCRKCGAWKGQLGQEKDPRDYIEHLVEIFDTEAKRTLKPTGQLWVNLGDSYSKDSESSYVQKKQKLMLPTRFAAAMQDRGWVLRNDVIWAKSVAFQDGRSKGGGLPSSVHDRFNASHEYFFFFIKSSRERRPYFVDIEKGGVAWGGSKVKETREYYSNLDSVRIPSIWVNEKGERTDFYGRVMGSRPNAGGSPKQHAAGQPHLYMYNHPLGKNPGSVWQFNSEQFEGEHDSPYPPRLIQQIIKFGCPERCCPVCGLPQERRYVRKTRSFKLARCGCNSELRAGLVLDPFMGSGSTAIASLREGRHFIGFELNPNFIEGARARLREEGVDNEQTKFETFVRN